jgi:hypothetical protein
MNRAMLRARACCWIGAAFDAAMVVPMLSPPIAARMFAIEGLHPGVEYRFAMFIGASLMLGWTGLLIWAGMRPLERRGVLLLTVVPVLPGLAAAGGYAVSAGLIAPARMAPTWIIQAALAAAFAWAYFGQRASVRNG